MATSASAQRTKLSADSAWRTGIFRLYGIDPEAPRGTAFGIGPRVALTCHHCVDGADPQRLILRQSGGEAAAPLLVAEILFPADPLNNDIAILRMAQDLPSWIPAIALEPLEGVQLVGFGFPGSAPRQPLVRIDVDHRGVQPANYGGYRLDAALILAKEPAVHGMSGGPVIEARSGAAVAMVVGGPDYDGRAIALPLWMVSNSERPWEAFDQAIDWNATFTEQRGWAMNGVAASAICREQVGEAVRRLARRGSFDADRYVGRPSFEAAVMRFLSGDKPAFLLSGAANVGKTSALAWLADRMAGRALLLDGFQLGGLRQSLFDCLQEQLAKHPQSSGDEKLPAVCQALRRACEGELVILVDSLNEAGASASELRAWLSDAVNHAAELGCRLIMSCRSDHASVAELDDAQTECFELDMFDELEARAALLAYGIEEIPGGALGRHPLMYRIAARAPDPAQVFRQGRHRAIRTFVHDTIARCTGVAGAQVDSLLQGCCRIADHSGLGEDDVSFDFAANQVGGFARLEALIEGAVFKSRDDRIRFSLDDVAAGLCSPVNADSIQLGVLWRRAFDDPRMANRLTNSLLACEAREDERRLSEHLTSLITVLGEVADRGDSRRGMASVSTIICRVVDALPSTRVDIRAQAMSRLREVLVQVSVGQSGKFGLPRYLEHLVIALQLPWMQKAELWVQLLPLLNDSGLRTKDLVDRGGGEELLRVAGSPSNLPSALVKLIRDHTDDMRELLLPHLDDRRRLLGQGETSAGELIRVLLLLTSSAKPGELMDLLLGMPDSPAAKHLLRDVAGLHPTVSLDRAITYLDRGSAIAVLQDIIGKSLHSAGVGRAPLDVLAKLRSILRDSTPESGQIAAELIRICEPDDLEAWDFLAHAVATGRRSESLRPVPGKRHQQFLQVLRGRADRYAIGEIEYEQHARLQKPMAQLASRMLVRALSRFGDEGRALGRLAESKGYMVAKHKAFTPWLDFLFQVAAHPNSDLKEPVIYVVQPCTDSPEFHQRLWSEFLGPSADDAFVTHCVAYLLGRHDVADLGPLLHYFQIALQRSPESALQGLYDVAEREWKPSVSLCQALSAVLEHLQREPPACLPEVLRICKPEEACQQFAAARSR